MALDTVHKASCDREGCNHRLEQHAQRKGHAVARCLLCDCKGFLPATITPWGANHWQPENQTS